MPINYRPYFLWYDGSVDKTSGLQGDNPAGNEYLPIGVANRRSILNVNGSTFAVGDATVASRGAKNIIWSSEGYTSNLNVVVPALTANQKKATGSHIANAGGTLGTVAGALDLSPYRAVNLVVVLSSFTGGSSPSFLPELDYIDDAGTPNVIPLWKPSAVTSATSWWISTGQSLIFPQAATAPSTGGAGFTAFAAVTGWTIETIGLPVLPNAQFQWTIANTPTAVAWTGILYGIY